MTSKNKIPSNWLAAIEMADKIEEIVLIALKATRATKTTYKCALQAIGELVGSDDPVIPSRREK